MRHVREPESKAVQRFLEAGKTRCRPRIHQRYAGVGGDEELARPQPDQHGRAHPGNHDLVRLPGIDHGQPVGALHLFERVEGDYFAIVGLPLLPFLAFLREKGLLDG